MCAFVEALSLRPDTTLLEYNLKILPSPQPHHDSLALSEACQMVNNVLREHSQLQDAQDGLVPDVLHQFGAANYQFG